MTVTFHEIENIIKTLPVGYYIGRNVEITLSETEKGSYYDAMHDNIVVSYPMLHEVLVNVDEAENAEETVRTLTYHEVSHAFLTPRKMRMTDVRSIFEDERIETLLRHFYKMTDFKKFLLRVTKFNAEKPNNKMEAFYQLVRFRIGEPEFLLRVHDIIEEYKTLSQSNDRYYWRYEDDIDELWNDFSYAFDAKMTEMKDNAKSSESSENNETSNNETSSSSEGTSQEADDSQSSETSQSSADANGSENSICTSSSNEDASFDNSKVMKEILERIENEYDSEYDETNAEQIMKESSDCFVDSEITEQVQSILARISKTTSRNGSAINAYSGVFDPRSVIRDDYKYFVQQNRNGHVRAYSKTHLTLVIDRSGSFYASEKTVNKLLYALHLFEKSNPDFTFDLITCGVSEQLEEKSNRTLKTGGGNLLDKKIFDLMRQSQKPGCSNYNIILFDGDAFSDTWHMTAPAKSYYENFGAFNLPNATIISDPDNEKHIKRYCKNAKQIISYDYTSELVRHTLNALQMLTR